MAQRKPTTQKKQAVSTRAWSLTRGQVARVKPLFTQFGWFLAVFGLTAAASATLIWAPAIGVYVNAAALAVLMVLAVTKLALRYVAISLALVPMANLVVGSFMPRTTLGSVALFAMALLVIGSVYRYMFSQDAPQTDGKLPLKSYALVLPLMAVLGQALGVVGYVFLRNHYQFTGYSLPLVFPAIIVFAIAEEVVVRGLIQQRAATVFHPVMAALGSAAVYALLALDHATMLSVPVAITLGLILAFTYYLRQNLILTITMNAAAKLTYVGLVAAFILR